VDFLIFLGDTFLAKTVRLVFSLKFALVLLARLCGTPYPECI
jgi:hypothetical protein